MDPLIIDNNQLEKIRGLTSQFPYTCAENDFIGNAIPWHWHEEFEFKYVRAGSIKVTTEQHEYILQKGEACFTNSNVLETSELRNTQEDTRVISYLFHPVLLTGHYQSIFEEKYIKPGITARLILLLSHQPQRQAPQSAGNLKYYGYLAASEIQSSTYEIFSRISGWI